MTPVIENALYLLVLLNPASKIMFLASCNPPLTKKENFELSWKSSAAALLMLLVVTAAGDVLLRRVFHVELYALQITGGLVVFMIGWTAIREGHFTSGNPDQSRSFTDLSLVPLAAPLIAGPGMIAAAIAGSVQYGMLTASLSLLLSLSVNFILMILAGKISRVLMRTHLLGPVIRMTGLVIAVTAMQMIFSGLKAGWSAVVVSISP